MNNWNSTFSNLFLEENISHLVHLKCIWKQMPINQKYYYLRKKIEMGEKSLLERIGEEPRHLGPEKAEFQREGNLVFVSRSSFSLWAFDDPKQNSGQQKGK